MAKMNFSTGYGGEHVHNTLGNYGGVGGSLYVNFENGDSGEVECVV